MKKILYILFVLSLFASCNQDNKLTAFLRPFKKITLNFEDLNQFREVSFVFIIDASASMPDRKQILSDNIVFLEDIFEQYPHYIYNVAFTSMSPVNFFNKTRPFLSLNQKSCGMDFSKLVVDTNLGSYLRYSFSQNLDMQAKDFVCLISHNIETINGSGGIEPFFASLSYIVERSDLEFKSRFFGQNNFLILFFLSDAYGINDEDFAPFLRVGNPEKGAEVFSENYWNFLRTAKGEGKNIRSYAVVPDSDLDDQCGAEESTGSAPHKYPFHLYKFIERTGGLRVSLCDPSWGVKLKAVYADLRNSFFSKSIYLKEVPKEGTIEVFFNGKRVPRDRTAGWSFHPEELSISLGNEFNVLLYPGKWGEDGEQEGLFEIRYQPVNIELLMKEE